MITAIIFLSVALFVISTYLVLFKKAGIQIVFIKGLILGFSTYSEQFDESETTYLDIFLGFIIISVIYDD